MMRLQDLNSQTKLANAFAAQQNAEAEFLAMEIGGVNLSGIATPSFS